MDSWFAASASEAYFAARLADAVVASARAKGALPFELACRPHKATAEPAGCSIGVRTIVAAANPRAIGRVTGCEEKTKLPCLAVGLAQRSGQGLSAAEAVQWNLNVQYQSGNELRIERVDVDDLVAIHIDY
ncbi:MAG: hypothetical protein ABIW83_01245 [Allosphingosinicella sp.]